MNLSHARIACSQCHLHDLCLPVGLSAEQMQKLETMVEVRRSVKKKDSVFSNGDPFHALYAIRAGFFKSSVSTREGIEQVTGFHMAGEIIGLDGIANDVHHCTVQALEDSEVCEIPFDRLEFLIRDLGVMQHHVHRLMSGEIVRDHAQLLQLGSMNANQRVADFLLDMAARQAARGFSSTEFVLRMTRQELGSFLGLSFETVSRTLSSIADQGILAIDNKQVSILDVTGLKQLARSDRC